MVQSPWTMMDENGQPIAQQPQMAQAAPTQSDLEQIYLRDINSRKVNVQKLREKLMNLSQEEEGLQGKNLKPLLAFADSLIGTRTADSYVAPTQKKEVEALKLQGLADKEQQALSDDQMNYLKLKEASAANDERLDMKKMFLQAYKQKIANDKDTQNEKLDKPEKTTAEQDKAAGFARRLQQTQEVIDKLMNEGYQGPTRMDQVRSYGPNEGQNQQFQRYDQTARNFINATLRRESGASISPSEFENAKQQYLPQPGDSPEKLAQKAANRRQVFENFKSEARSAFDRTPYISPTGEKSIMKSTVTVKKGNEVLEIPRDDLKSAIRDGYQEVK
jgi:hypothetical protein